MSPDERIAALIRLVELILSMHKDNQRRWAEAMLEMQSQRARMRTGHVNNQRPMTAIHADIRDILARVSRLEKKLQQ